MIVEVAPTPKDTQRFVDLLVAQPPELPWEQGKKVVDADEDEE